MAERDGQLLNSRLEHLVTLIVDGARVSEEMRSIGYEFGMERELKIKADRFIERLRELGDVLTLVSTSDSAQRAASIGEVCVHLIGQIQDEKAYVAGVCDRLRGAKNAAEALLDPFRHCANDFGDRARTLDGLVNRCRELRGTLRAELAFDHDKPT